MSEAAVDLDVPALLGSLRQALGEASVQTAGLDAFLLDGNTPAAALLPANEEQVATALRLAATAGAAVIPVGGGRHRALGNVPERYTLALSLSRLDRVVEYEPGDLTATFEAGVTLAAIQRRLGEHGQWLPLEAPPEATIGGILAAGIAGPCRHRYGAPRDFLIGIHAVLADGTAVQSGGRVVKNVAGYDMGKLYTGSLGTLAVITRATFKLSPLPAARALAVLGGDTPEEVAEAAFQADDSGLALEAVEVVDRATATAAGIAGEHAWGALLRLAGSRGAVERSLAALAAPGLLVSVVLRADEEAAAWAAYTSPPPVAFALRFAILPSRVAAALSLLAGLATRPESVSASLTTGSVRARWAACPANALTLVEELRMGAAADGGACVVEAAPPGVKAAVDVFGPVRGDFGLMRRLKDGFDPRRVLSPGRFVGRL